MTNEEFAVWVAGYLRLCPGDLIEQKKLYILRNHLNLVQAVTGALDERNRSLWHASELVLANPTATQYTQFNAALRHAYSA